MIKKTFKEKGIKIAKGAIWPILSFLLLFVVWYLAVKFTGMRKSMPNPIDVLASLFRTFVEPIGRYTLIGHIWFSMQRVLVGYGVALVLGVVTGIAMGWSRTAEAAIKPLFTIVRSIPSIAWIPLSILWFGVDEMSKYYIIGLAAFVTITANAYGGANTVDMQLVGAARMLGSSESQVFTKVVIPSSLPSIFAGMQVGISTSWMAMLAAEMIRSNEGLGWMIIAGMESNNLIQIFVGIITIGFMGLLLVNVIKFIEGGVYRWKKKEG